MRIYLTIKSIPELRDLEIPDRTRGWNAAFWLPLKDWRAWAVLGGWFVLDLIGFRLFVHLESVWFGERTFTSWLVCGGIKSIFFGVGCFIYLQTHVHLMRPHLRKWLNAGLKEQNTP